MSLHFPRTLLACLLVSAGTAQAADIDRLQNLAQDEFKLLTKDLTSALSYKAIAPATPLGITGFDLGIALTGTTMNNSGVWEKATGHALSILPVPKLYVSKGLPFGIDIGGFYTAIPTTNIKLYGANIQYAILEGSATTPALAVRGAVTKLAGVDQLDFTTQSVELVVSKGLVGLTPYFGIGSVRGKGTPHVLNLSAETTTETKFLAGINWNIVLGNLAVEFDRTGKDDSLSLKLGLRW